MVKKKKKFEPKKVQANNKNVHISTSMKVTESIGTPTSIFVHTLLFIGIFVLRVFGFSTENILLILTTVVSLEAIYLSIFIQMSINENTRSLKAVEEDVDEIAEDVDELQKDIEGIEDDVEDISEDIDKIQAEEQDDEEFEKNATKLIEKMESQMQVIINELNALKQKRNGGNDQN
jgi:low affinity Fe/Cu permease